MATSDQLNVGKRGGGRVYMSKGITLTLVSGALGVIGTGSITGGSGGTNGTYPLVLTGGTVNPTGGYPASGIVTVSGNAVTSIAITSPGNYSVAPTGVSFANVPGLTGASVASITTAQVAYGYWTPPAGTRTSAIRVTNPVAITGSPTNVNVSAGLSFLGADFVSAVDLKAAGVTNCTLVSGGLAELIAATGVTYYVQAVVVGVTNATGTLTAEILHAPPNP